MIPKKKIKIVFEVSAVVNFEMFKLRNYFLFFLCF